MKFKALSAVISVILAGGCSVAWAEQSDIEVPGKDPLLLQKEAAPSTFRYKTGNRFTLHSNKLPIMDIDPTVAQPSLGYISEITQEIDLLHGIAPASASIFRTPDLPMPPTPQVAFTDEFEIKARYVNSYFEANEAWTSTFGALFTNADNRFAVLGLKADVDDYEFSDGRTLNNSGGDRDAYIISYGRKLGNSTLDYTYMKTNGDDMGAPVHTMDVEDLEATGHVLEYTFTGSQFEINAHLRDFSIDQKRNNWKDRDWYKNEAIASEQGFFKNFNPATGEGLYQSPYCGMAPPGSPWDNCQYPMGPNGPGFMPNLGPGAVLPGAPLFDSNRNTHMYLGSLNSLVDLEQNVDVLDYRFDLSTEFAGGKIVVGVDGYRRDIDVLPSKPWDAVDVDGNLIFSYENVGLTNPIIAKPGTDPNAPFNPFDYGLTAQEDWQHFQIQNYVEDNMDSVFVDYYTNLNASTELYLGARYKSWEHKNELHADERGVNGRFLYEILGLRTLLEDVHGVYYNGIEGQERYVNTSGVNPNADGSDLDLVASLTHQLNDKITVSMSLANYYEQANSYERVFPAAFDPASSSSDGKIYMGDTDLESENHKRIEFGFQYAGEDLFASARVYYDRIDDYIQGVQVIETLDPTAFQGRKELAAYYQLACNTAQYTPELWAGMMPPGMEYDPLMPLVDPMSGQPISFAGDCGKGQALRYANIDAEIYGFDANWSYWITPQLQFSGLVAYQRGKRRDTAAIDLGLMPELGGNGVTGNGEVGYVEEDNLYQVLPGYADLGLTYYAGPVTAQVNANLYMRQDNVSVANLEQETAGYGIVNTMVSYNPHPAIGLDFGVNNVLDKDYTDHITGVNRANNQSEDPNLYNPGDRIAGIGRNAFVRLTLGIKWPMK